MERHTMSSSLAAAFILAGVWLCTSLLPLASGAASIITHLPGYDGPLPFYLETGYVEVDEVRDSYMYYYFIKSERNPEEDPVMFWLTGGPGCSGLSGLFYEIGPLTFDPTSYQGGFPNLFRREHSWTKVANIIFPDSPIGTGFSFSKRDTTYVGSDFKTVSQVYTFIQKWFVQHPEFLSNPLYISGDSYSGRVVPVIAQKVANGNSAGSGFFLNLKGYTVGNPVTNSTIDRNARYPFSHGMGLISDELYKSATEECGGDYVNPKTIKCASHVAAMEECISKINVVHILEPLCKHWMYSAVGRRFNKRSRGLPLPDSDLPSFSCRGSTYKLSLIWANNDSVREVLNIDKGIISSWRRCNDMAYHFGIESVVPHHHRLTTSGYRALIYSGDHDAMIPFVGTQEWIRSLNFLIIDDWRPWMVDGQVAGFTRTYFNNLTFATVKGGGHTAPEYRPKECLVMIERWISGGRL